jgi:hypothetical protein
VLALGIIVQSACAARHQAVSPTSLSLNAVVEAHRVGEVSHPVATVTLKNVGNTHVAVSKTHGFGAQARSWLSLRIERVGNAEVQYPPGSPDLVMSAPRYVCLGPAESVQWEIDLLAWRPEFGGKAEARYLAFDLTPGMTYTLQAEYTDSSEWARESGSRCGGVTGTVVSNSIAFALP